MKVKGVDISGAQGVMDFAKLKQSDARFAILKAGFGMDYPGQQDSQWERNIREVERVDMPYGVYHVRYATTYDGGVQEAAHLLRLLGARKPAYGVWYDMEEPSSTVPAECAASAKGFCESIEKAGLYVGVYASAAWFKNYLTDPVFDKYDKWVAQYADECQIAGPGIWQFTSTASGSAYGAQSQYIDVDWAYKDYPALTGNKEDEEEENVVRYNRISEMPVWAQRPIAKIVDNGYLFGRDDSKDENGRPASLDLSDDMLRIYVTNERAGVYDKKRNE